MEKKDFSALVVGMILCFIIIGWSFLYFESKNRKVEKCISDTGHEISCKCVYKECYEADRDLLSKE